MNMIDFEFRGGHYHLYFNGEALFNFYNKFGQEQNILDVITPATKEAFEANVWLLCEMSHQGELYRRFLGESPEKPLDYLRTVSAIQPAEISEMKMAVTKAVAEGFTRQHPDPELEEDPWLAEVESKKKQQSQSRSIFVRLRLAWALLFGKG